MPPSHANGCICLAVIDAPVAFCLRTGEIAQPLQSAVFYNRRLNPAPANHRLPARDRSRRAPQIRTRPTRISRNITQSPIKL